MSVGQCSMKDTVAVAVSVAETCSFATYSRLMYVTFLAMLGLSPTAMDITVRKSSSHAIDVVASL